MKLAYFNRVCNSKFHDENTVCSINDSRTETHKISDTLQPIGRNDLKCILTCLHCAKYNEINTCHLYV